MSKHASPRNALDELLEWEGLCTIRNDMYEGESVEYGPFDGFVDRATRFVEALREAKKIDTFLATARQFESRLAPGTALDNARLALQPIVKAFADKDSTGGVTWVELKPPHIREGGRPWRPKDEVISRDEVTLIRNLGTSTDCLRWNPSESLRQIQGLLDRRLVPPLPDRERLERFENLLAEFCQSVEGDAVWGCWLLIQCEEATGQSPIAFAQLVRTLNDTHIKAIKSAARCVHKRIGSPSVSQPDTNSISDTKSKPKPRATLSFVHGKPAVLFEGKDGDISGLSASLLNVLYGFKRNDRIPTYKTTFEAVYKNNSYSPEPDCEAPQKLRQLAQRVKKSLKTQLGPPPDGKPWIRTRTRHGYYLTDAVTWQAKVEWSNYDFDNVKANSGR